MELLEAIHHRRATREFSAAPVSVPVINKLIDAAIWAPSAVNQQPWLFTVVRDQTLLDKISAESKKHMLAQLEGGSGHPGFREHLANPAFHIFYHAPVLILISALQQGGWAIEDAALAAENLMLAATAEGLGTCWIGFAQRWLASAQARKLIDLPAQYLPVAPIIVGHPKAAIPPVPRKTPTVQWIG